MRPPAKVLHVLNGASGGAALSTLGLIASLEQLGVASCAVCHTAGTPAERTRLADAVRGEVVFTPLYWWNRKIRYPLVLRPVAEARQVLRTGWTRRSASQVARAAARWGAELIHTNTIVTPEGGLAAAALGLPHVWHVRELIGPGKPYRFWREGRAFGERVARRASRLIASRSRIRGVGSRRPLFVFLGGPGGDPWHVRGVPAMIAAASPPATRTNDHDARRCAHSSRPTSSTRSWPWETSPPPMAGR